MGDARSTIALRTLQSGSSPPGLYKAAHEPLELSLRRALSTSNTSPVTKKHPRADYRKFSESSFMFLGEKTKSTPCRAGVCHHACWMAKTWFTASLAITAPKNDMTFFKGIKEWASIDPAISKQTMYNMKSPWFRYKPPVLCVSQSVSREGCMVGFTLILTHLQIVLKTTFNWHAVPEHEKKRHKNSAEPVWSPTMAGGLFAIDRQFFERLGTYDNGFDIWGGENLELSFKTWMCGGTLEIVPCSHVGHIFRKRSPYKWRSGVNVLKRNSIRLSEVWLDEYAKYYYQRIGHDK
ncbi:hypothetical protein PV328_004019, partial [Microctonus aethiopoides]